MTDLLEYKPCFTCGKTRHQRYLIEGECIKCINKDAFTAPCFECEEPETKYNPLIDTETDRGIVERYHVRCWFVAMERWQRALDEEK